MVSEITINRLENVLTEVIDFSGTKEQTTIISNMEVVNAAPAGLTGFVTIRDDRDGDTILATKVPGVLYANADLVNVLFIDGTEPIAFQQASASSGDPVAVSKLVSPDLAIDPVISADNSGDVTLAGTGELILPDDIIHSGDTDTLISLEDNKIVFQAGGLEMISIIEAATDEVVINDGQVDINFRVEGDTEDNLLFTDAGNDRIGIATNAPDGILHIIWATQAEAPQLEFTGAGNAPAEFQFLHNSASPASNDGLGEFAFYGLNDAGSPEEIAFASIGGFSFDISDGAEIGEIRFRNYVDGTRTIVGRWIGANLRIGTTGAPSAKVHIDQQSTTAAEPVLLLDQADISEEFLKLVGAAAAATLTQSLVDEGDVTTATRIGWYKINVDDVGNQITDGDYWVPFFSLA